jgi:hypothetical protein
MLSAVDLDPSRRAASVVAISEPSRVSEPLSFCPSAAMAVPSAAMAKIKKALLMVTVSWLPS